MGGLGPGGDRAFSLTDIPGFADGFVPEYSTTTAVIIKAGSVEANGKSYAFASDTAHTMTSLASGFDFHYIYVDDSASTAPTAVIIDSTTEPAWSDANRGWYNGDDRCIGVVPSLVGAAEVTFFEAAGSGKRITSQFMIGQLPQMATDMDPSFSWQTPDDNDGSVITPVNAEEMQLGIFSSDTGALALSYAITVEAAAEGLAVQSAPWVNWAWDSALAIKSLVLGASRNIYITGADDDDNALSAWCIAYTYSR